MARKIEVEILGDSSSLERAFAASAKSAQKFNQQLSSSTTTGNLKAQTNAIQGITRAEEDLIKVRSRRASSLGPFRLAGVGLGAGLGLFAATQAARELASTLETTGAAAFTTGGRIKNMVSALTSGNLVGAFQALHRVPETIEEIGLTSVQARLRLEALQKISDGVADKFKIVGGAANLTAADMRELRAATDAANVSTKAQADALIALVDAQNMEQAVLRGLEFDQRKYNATVIDGKDALVEFKGAADDRAGPRGPGARAFETPFKREGRPSIGPLSPSQRRELSLIGQEGAARVPELENRLKQLNNQIKRGNINQKQRLTILTNIKNTEAEIAAIYRDQAAKRKADADAAAAAAAAAAQQRIATRTGWLQFGIEQAEATKTVKDDVSAWRALEKYLLERIRQEGRTLELVSELWRARQAITDLNKKKAGDPLAGLMQVSTKKLTGILAAGTGLTGGGRKALAANISGAQIQTYVNVSLDGQQVAKSVTTSQKRAGKRTGKQTSGRR